MRSWPAAICAALVLVAALAGCTRGGNAPGPRVIILGIDGLDPELLERRMAAGEMPNFARLRREGGFRRLDTSIPPQSPVAWASFITGTDPGGHAIFDFLRHDPRTLDIAESTSYRKEPFRAFGLPLWGGGMVNLRRGKAFWEHLEEAGIAATLFRTPANFPPTGGATRTFSGMGTPDLRGTNGTFTYFTDEPPEDAASFTGGEVVQVEVRDNTVRASLRGPPPVAGEGEPVSVPLRVYISPALHPELQVARIDAGGERRILRPGEWSDWVPLDFPLFPGVSAGGIVRFYLKELRPAFKLYASPVNLDPARPALPISTPARAAPDLCCEVGPYYTQGMPEDTKALQWQVFDDEEFFDQAWGVLEESERLLEHELGRFRGRDGLLFFYFSTIDQACHVLWRTLDESHPGHRPDFSPRLKGAIPALYAAMDRILGRVLQEVDARTTLIVMSDHGFAPFRRAVHLNNWLAEEGFLALYDAREPRGKRLKEDVDWLRTRAYAMGFNGIHLNLFGREPNGVVTEKTRAAVLDEIERRLLAWKDDDGTPVVSRVYRAAEIYSGPYLEQAPELIVGYARGFRASWVTPLGKLGRAVIEDNTDVWSGDHMIAAQEVPGVLLANRPLLKERPNLVDLPVTVLDIFGIARPAAMSGSSVFKEN
jgi:predicted AlkP superfamily phosphohydrolase/phosphomutase